MSTINGNTPINLETVDIHENKSEQKQFKGNLRADTLLKMEKFGEVLNMSRSQILEESVNAYMNASYNWQTRRYFLEKKEKTFAEEDLKNFSSKTRVYVVSTLDKDSTYREWMCAYITSINGNMVTIQPSHLVNPFPAEYVLNISEDDLVIPKVVDWNPSVSAVPYWGNYRFTIDIKYIWYVSTEQF